MNTSPQKIIVTTEGFPIRPELTTHAEEKSAKLLRHTRPCVDTVRLHVKRETPHVGPVFFSVRATAEHSGPADVVHAEASQPDAAIRSAIDKLERALTTTAGARKHELHHPHPVELTANLPKTGAD
jgi:ribosome-associated translation inhibitor RaiA